MNVKLKCIFHLKVKYKMIVKNKINKCFKPCFLDMLIAYVL